MVINATDNLQPTYFTPSGVSALDSLSPTSSVGRCSILVPENAAAVDTSLQLSFSLLLCCGMSSSILSWSLLYIVISKQQFRIELYLSGQPLTHCKYCTWHKLKQCLYIFFLQIVRPKLVNARYCDKFAHVRWKDGSIMHVHVSGPIHRNYEQRILSALDSYRKRYGFFKFCVARCSCILYSEPVN